MEAEQFDISPANAQLNECWVRGWADLQRDPKAPRITASMTIGRALGRLEPWSRVRLTWPSLHFFDIPMLVAAIHDSDANGSLDVKLLSIEVSAVPEIESSQIILGSPLTRWATPAEQCAHDESSKPQPGDSPPAKAVVLRTGGTISGALPAATRIDSHNPRAQGIEWVELPGASVEARRPDGFDQRAVGAAKAVLLSTTKRRA